MPWSMAILPAWYALWIPVLSLSSSAFPCLARQVLTADIWIAFGTVQKYTCLHVNAICHYLVRERSAALSIFHCYTGCDTISAFCGKGKKSAWKVWASYPEVTQAFNYMAANRHSPLTLYGHTSNFWRAKQSSLTRKRAIRVLSMKHEETVVLPEEQNDGTHPTNSRFPAAAVKTSCLPVWNMGDMWTGPSAHTQSTRMWMEFGWRQPCKASCLEHYVDGFESLPSTGQVRLLQKRKWLWWKELVQEDTLEPGSCRCDRYCYYTWMMELDR